MSGYTFEKHSQYCTLRFTPELVDMAWADIEKSTERVTELVHNAGTNSVLVDLSALENMPSGVVTSLVRTWKGMDERSRKFVIVAPSEPVVQELEQSGLTSLWKITASDTEAYVELGVLAPTDPEMDAVPVEDKKSSEQPAAVATNEPLTFTEQRLFCSVQMNPVLMSMQWADVEAATNGIVAKINESQHNSVLVDISRMEMINSGLVALLVRIWKTTQESNGQFSLVSPNEMVTGVLKSAGLWKLWSVVDDRDEGVYDLGVSKGAQVEQRERRILVLVAVPCALMAAMALIPMLMNRVDVVGVNFYQSALLLAAAAVATGAISVVKDSGGRRKLSIAAVVVGLGVLSTLWFHGNPVDPAQSGVRSFDALGQGGEDQQDSEAAAEDSHPKNRRKTGAKSQNGTSSDSPSQGKADEAKPEEELTTEQEQGTAETPKAKSDVKPTIKTKINKEKLKDILKQPAQIASSEEAAKDDAE